MNTVAYSPQERTRTFLSILLFAALAFLITWGTGMAVVLSTHADLVNGARQVQHPIRLPLALAITLIVIGGYGPALAAIAVTAWHSGRSGVRDLLSQFRRWRVHPIWFAAALLGPALLGLISLCLTSLSGASTPRH